jgi:hypothetical protein
VISISSLAAGHGLNGLNVPHHHQQFFPVGPPFVEGHVPRIETKTQGIQAQTGDNPNSGALFLIVLSVFSGDSWLLRARSYKLKV